MHLIISLWSGLYVLSFDDTFALKFEYTAHTQWSSNNCYSSHSHCVYWCLVSWVVLCVWAAHFKRWAETIVILLSCVCSCCAFSFFSERTANFEQLAVIYDITICCYSNHSFALVHNKCSITSVEIRLNFVLYMLHLATEGLVMMFLCCTY